MEVLQHRVRYNEVDEQGIVFNSHYLTWCDHAAYEFFRLEGWSPITLKEMGFDFVLKKVEITYESPAGLDNLVTVDASVLHVGKSSFKLKYDMSADEHLCTIEILYVNIKENQSFPIPYDIKNFLETLTASEK
ncbi:acyl-CoA thioesterase [Salinicoccus sp. Marseille-QA3877]